MGHSNKMHKESVGWGLSILLRDCTSKDLRARVDMQLLRVFCESWGKEGMLLDVQIRIVTYGDGSDLSIALVRQILEYPVQFGVCVCLNYVGKLKKVQEWAKK